MSTYRAFQVSGQRQFELVERELHQPDVLAGVTQFRQRWVGREREPARRLGGCVLDRATGIGFVLPRLLREAPIDTPVT